MHSWTPHLRRLCLGLVVLGVAGVAYAELGNPATNTAACCTLTTSLVNDVLRGKDSSGDERFFSAEGAPPNIHFLVDLSGSMRELPQVINSEHSTFFNITTNGCDNPRLDAFEASRGWDPNFQYPVPDTGTGLGSDFGFPNLFRDDKFYAYMYWNDSSNPSYQWNTKEEACQSQVIDWNGTNTAVYNRCVQCLSTKGFWKLPGASARDSAPLTNLDFIFWGRFLNFNPPKYVTAKAVLKSVIKDLRRVRAGISVFAPNTNPYGTSLAQPQNPSCSQIINDASAFDANRASYINTVNGWTFTTGTPLAKSLLNVGYYFTSDDSIYQTKFGFGAAYTYPNEFKNGSLTSQGRSVCWGCQVSSVIIITDGEPSGDGFGATLAGALRSTTNNNGPVYCPDSAPCFVNNVRDSGSGLKPPNDYSDDNKELYLDDVAKLLYEHDLQANTPPLIGDFNTAGKQSIITYTVGFGVNSNLLKHTAEVGGGLYYTAEDQASLKAALLDIITNVQTRATSFSSPAATTLQVRDASATLVPRFKPARSKTEPWQGLMYRFNMGPESLLDCEAGNASSPGDLNRDGDCDDTLLIDAAGDAVIENDDGDFVKLLSPLTPAVPFWEAGKLLKDPNSTNTQRWKTRRIYTMVDNYPSPNGDGKLDFRDTPVEFTEANAGVLREYLGISQNPNACTDLAAKLGVPSLTPDDCAKVVIRWYRGADALNSDPAKRDYDRPFLLGDIFHSSPIPVDPPMPRNFCSFSSQCIQSLFSGATQQQSDYTTPDHTGVPAYDKFEYEAGDRDKIVLVGSNDGLLHAFQNGTTDGTIDKFTSQRKYNAGTGQEIWAFVPPDLLPKLRPNLGKHAYFVDGSPMVRNVWVDGSEGQPADGKKQWQEYRTVAVVGTGRGGVHRFALDLTRLIGRQPGDSSSLMPNTKGDFLWMWPQPCDPLALQVGESFSNFAPRPPPIGPVALSPAADDDLRSMYGGSGSPESPWLIDNQPARERYVVFLNGGFDQSMTRGRGMAIVDISSGHTIWSFFYNDGKGRSQHLLYPIGAGLGPMDVGTASSGTNEGDYLFDTATVGDYGGQLWTLRFWSPGQWDGTRKQVSNWYAARSFRVANMSGNTSDPEAIRAPFSYMTLNARQPENGFVRTFVGTGDRENLLDKGSVCRLSNPRACAVQGCGVNNTITVERGGSTLYTTNTTFQNYALSSATSTVGTAGQSCAGAQVTLAWDNTAANGCGNGNDGSIQYKCDGNTTTWSCRETTNTWVALNYTATSSPYPQRYYGLWTYGGMDPKRKFNTESEAATYDNNLYTDTDLVNVSQFDSTGKVIEASQMSAAPSGKGWVIEYAATNERTGTTGALTNGCVLWNSFEPSGASGAVCATTGTNKARLYQANYTTGRADCAVGFYDTNQDRWARYISTDVGTAPPEPTLQISIGNGQVSFGLTEMSAGNNPRNTTARQNDDAVKSLYQLELDRRAHNCRHGGVDCN